MYCHINSKVPVVDEPRSIKLEVVDGFLRVDAEPSYLWGNLIVRGSSGTRNHVWGTYRFRIHNPEEFLSCYNDGFRRVRLRFESVSFGTQTIGFSIDEISVIRQKIVLDLMYFNSVNRMPLKVTATVFDGLDTIRTLLWAAGTKYGTNSERTVALVAHIFNMSIQDIRNRIEADRLMSER